MNEHRRIDLNALRRSGIEREIVSPIHGGIGGTFHDVVETHDFQVVAPTEDQRLDEAFDAFIAHTPTLAPWLDARNGPGIESAAAGTAQLPDGAADWPRLESGMRANTLSNGGEWLLPDVVAVDGEDPLFAFAAVQTGEIAEEGGGPFNRATLTVMLSVATPAGLVPFAEVAGLRRVPDLQLTPILTVPVVRPNGSTVVQRVTGSATPAGDDHYTATFALTGSTVPAAYTQLTRRGQAAIEVRLNYSGYQTALVTVPDAGFPHGPTFHGFQFQVFGDGGITAGSPFEPVNPFPGVYRFFPVTAGVTRTVALALRYDTDAYRSRFTIAADGVTRPIIDATDLTEFAGPRSEYRELSSAGDVSAKYPSLQRLYFGQVSGTVVAVPAAYGIQRTAAGLAARCDSVIDDSPVSLTGSRFHFTFTVAPLVDPADLARLGADLPALPEAAGRTLRLTLPEGLDGRNASSLDGFPSARTAFADDHDGAVTVSVDVADDGTTPATTNVNLFLHQLASAPPAPLFGALAMRLDDVYPTAVRSRLTLNLNQSADGDDLTVHRDPGGTTATVANVSPLDEVLHESVSVVGGHVSVAALGNLPLAAGRSTTVATAAGSTVTAVSRDLALPAPVPHSMLTRYVAFHTETVQQVQHPLTVNASGVDFTGAGITTIDVLFTLVGREGIAVPGLTLSPSHAVDFTHARIPIEAAVTGLQTRVVLTVHTAAGTRGVTVDHDFVDEPILVLTSNTLA